MTVRSRKRKQLLIGETLQALEREKELFLARNQDKCSHLLVRFVPDRDDRNLIITAAFTFDEQRTWHQVQAEVAATELRREVGPGHAIISAFGDLEDGISTARIARLFAPLSVTQRMVVSRS